MVKGLVVFVILLIVPVFVSGCTSVKPESVEPPEVSGIETESDMPRPRLSEPDQNEPDKIKPIDIEPDEIVPTGLEPGRVEPAVSEPDDLKSVPAATFHDKCKDILKEFVYDNGMVDYQGLRRKRLELRALLREFDKLDRGIYESWPVDDKIAFWINVYNLHKLSVITDNYPIKPSSRVLTIFYRGTNSIRHIEEKITQHKFLVMDEEFTFAVIEKLYFRGEFDDPRVFFAISSGCLSSPPLRNEPY